jgi:methionyl aminopeptidase
MDDFLKAGKITKHALEFARKTIREGVNIYEFVKSIEDRIHRLGGGLAFPVNISINEDAAHDTADYKGDKVFTAGQLVKVDIGAQVNGYIGDSAFTKEIRTKKYTKLIKASEEALKEALKIIKPGVKLYEIGIIIEEVINSYGYKPIMNLGGHGLEKYNLHAGLFIPNYNNHDRKELKNNQMIAVEPFATTGKGKVSNTSIVKIHSFQKDKPVRSISARKLQNYIQKEFHTLPFAEHHLYNKFKPIEVKLGLKELIKSGCLKSYPVLKEVSDGLVSQAEHSVLVKDEPVITTG